VALSMEIGKLIMSSSLEYARGASQVLQAVTGLLLTTYVALFVALGKEYGFFDVSPFITALPAAFFVASLGLLFARAATYKGGNFTFRDAEGTLAAYKRALDQRRGDLVIPSALTMLGIASLGFVLIESV